MATILFAPTSTSYNCPQRVDLTEENVQSTVRRLSEQTERRRSEVRRKSMISMEKASMSEKLSSLRQGKLPTNQQINGCISKFLNSRITKSQPMSEDGKRALKDIQGLLVAIQRSLFLKNSDELFQSMFYHTKMAMDSQDPDELKLGTFAVLKIIKFLLFDDKYRNLLSSILLTVQIVLEKNMKGFAPGPERKTNSAHIVSCLRNIFTTLRKHPSYQSPLETLLNLIILWTDRLTSSHEAAPYTEKQELAASEAKEIFERWTQNTQLNPFLRKLNDLACSVRSDPKLSVLYKKTKELSSRSLEEDVFDEKSWSEIINDLECSDEVLKYRQKMLNLVGEGRVILESFKGDPISEEISEKLYSLHNNLWKNKTILKPHMLEDIKMTLLPALIEQISYIPLPQLNIQDNEQYEIMFGNMALPGDTLMPKEIELKVDDYLKFYPDSDVGSASIQGLFIKLHGIQTSMEDVKFSYRRRAGFMEINDSGIASVNIENLTLSLRLESNSKDHTRRFQVEHCECSISKILVQVKQSKHSQLYKIFNPVLTGMVKRQITKEIEKGVTHLFNKGNAKLTKHLGGRSSEKKEKRRGSFISYIAQSVNQKIIGIQ